MSKTTNMNRSLRIQRGSILIYTMLTMSAMLAIGITTTSVFIGRLQRMRSLPDSMIALYAADSANEKCLYELRKNSKQTMNLTSGATYTIMNGASSVTSDCRSVSSTAFTIRTVATYKGISRSLEISQ